MKLPELIKFENHSNVWEDYIEVVYGAFRDDFIENKVFYLKKKIIFRSEPLFQGKEWIFWHLTSEGKDEEKRTPCLRRCERIKWIKPIIEWSKRREIKVWKNERNKRERTCLCTEEWEYLVVLEEKKNKTVLITAHYVDQNHRKRKLENEYNLYHKDKNRLMKRR